MTKICLYYVYTTTLCLEDVTTCLKGAPPTLQSILMVISLAGGRGLLNYLQTVQQKYFASNLGCGF